MTIQEAIKSGKKFMRPTHLVPFHLNERGLLSYDVNDEIIAYTLDKEDILADDWIIQEQKIIVTLDDLVKAYYDSFPKTTSLYGPNLSVLAKKLGFK